MKEKGGLIGEKEGDGDGGAYERVMRGKYDKSIFHVCEIIIMKSIILCNYYILIKAFYLERKGKLSDNIYKYIKQYRMCVIF